MPDEGVAGAVLDAVDASAVDTAVDDTAQQADTGDPAAKLEQDKQDNRKQPDALKKHIADLRRRADAITDPVEKKSELDRIKFLYDTSGKARGYEEQFSTVREAREVKAFFDAVGGREGVQKMQTTLSEVEQIDRALSAGDPSVIDRMWQDAPEGMPKLVPAIVDRLAKENPAVYAQAITPHALNIFEQAGFLSSVGNIIKELEEKSPSADHIFQIAKGMESWFNSQRDKYKTLQQAPKVDPEMERLRKENETLRKGDESKRIDSAYSAILQHAAPAIDKFLKPQTAKLGLTAEQYSNLREQVWAHLQTTRNANDTYKIISPSKQKQSYGAWTDYAKQWTDDNAEESARAMVKKWYGHQLQNGVNAATKQVTKAPGTPQIQSGKEPSPSEIDYSGKGIAAAKKAGYKDLADMILSGQAPLKAGGIRKWR